MKINYDANLNLATITLPLGHSVQDFEEAQIELIAYCGDVSQEISPHSVTQSCVGAIFMSNMEEWPIWVYWNGQALFNVRLKRLDEILKD